MNLDEIRALLEGITPGEWEVETMIDANARFVAAAPEIVRQLLAEIDNADQAHIRLSELVAKAQTKIDEKNEQIDELKAALQDVLEMGHERVMRSIARGLLEK